VRRFSRREIIGAISVVSLGTLVSACAGDGNETLSLVEAPPEATETALPTASPTMTPTPEPPFVLPEGREVRQLMAGSPQQTSLHVFGSGRPGPIVLALGGVHGNEPGGWLAAERVVDTIRPATGALLVIPRANRIAVSILERTTTDLGDLNRLYPGDPDGLPMARMAWEIMETIRAYRVNVLVDMHESWAFYRDRPQNGTAYLGQTLATFQTPPAIDLVRGVVESMNKRVRSPWEEFFYRDSPNRSPAQTTPLPQGTPSNLGQPGNGLGTSSLGIPRFAEGVIAVLVEMGQQQALERRIALHVDVLSEIMAQAGTGVA
jgi:hypothetical protein